MNPLEMPAIEKKEEKSAAEAALDVEAALRKIEGERAYQALLGDPEVRNILAERDPMLKLDTLIEEAKKAGKGQEEIRAMIEAFFKEQEKAEEAKEVKAA